MAIFPIQRPRDSLVELLDRGLGLLGYMAHNGVNHLSLVVPLFTLDDVLGRHAALGKIDITYSLLADALI